MKLDYSKLRKTYNLSEIKNQIDRLRSDENREEPIFKQRNDFIKKLADDFEYLLWLLNE